MKFGERAARNEDIFRSVNDEIDRGAAQHEVDRPLPFHCECGRAACVETVELTRHEYERTARERYCFIVCRGHENPAIERVVETHPTHLVVEKLGDAREQIDRDHPQQEHHGLPDDR